jgi:hypothetical protein
LLWFSIGIIVCGVLSKYDYVSVSRLNYLMPVVAVLAGLAFDRTLTSLGGPVSQSLRPALATAAVVALLGASTYANLHRWYVLAPSNVPSSPEAMVLRIVELPQCQRVGAPPLIVDEGVGGALGPALEARAGIVQPEFALYDEPTGWLSDVSQRCVIFRDTHDERAQRLIRVLEAARPEVRGVEEKDLANMTTVRVYYPTS